MKSPTSTIMHSIQALKSKLKDDQLQLIGLRRDFAMGPIKTIAQTQQRSSSPAYNQYKSNLSLQKNVKHKMLQIRKNHQNELKMLNEEHNKQKQQIEQMYQIKIKQLNLLYQDKIKEQDGYITLLQQQVTKEKTNYQQPKKFILCSKVYQINITQITFEDKIQFSMFHNDKLGVQTNQTNDSQNRTAELKNFDIKYQKIVNSLLKQNAELLLNLQRLKMQNRRLQYIQGNNNKYDRYEQEKRQIASNKQNESCFLNVNSKASDQKQYNSAVPVTLQINSRESYRNGCQNKRNRLKFSKVSDDRSRNITNRSYASISSENIDTSNIIFRDATSIQQDQKQSMRNSIVEQEEEQSILSQDMKLRTIKHFIKASSQRSTEPQESNRAYLIPKPPLRKGHGLKNCLKNISAI